MIKTTTYQFYQDKFFEKNILKLLNEHLDEDTSIEIRLKKSENCSLCPNSIIVEVKTVRENHD